MRLTKPLLTSLLLAVRFRPVAQRSLFPCA